MAIDFNRSELTIYFEYLEEGPALSNKGGNGIDGEADCYKLVFDITEGGEYAC